MKLTLRSQIYLLTVIPLVFVISVVSVITVQQARDLSDREIETFRKEYLRLRQQELRNYIDLALTAIETQRKINSPVSREAARKILRNMGFGDDGYYFIYDYAGVNLAHPKKPELEGENLYEFQDPKGNFVIQSLIDRAREGGGFHEYLWEKPSQGEVVGKLGYAVGLDDWQWMIGTGLYIDDIDDAVKLLEHEVDENIKQTLWVSAGVVLLAVVLVTALGLSINVTEGKLADRRLKELSQRTMQFEESEKRRLARELHDGINQMLAAARYRLEALTEAIVRAPDEALAHGEKASETIVAAIGEVRRISHDMRPLVLDDIGLVAALKSLADNFPLPVDVRADEQSLRLSPEIETALYRIAQEALANIGRHAQAESVSINLGVGRRSVSLLIRDDGIGISEELLSGTPGGAGLHNMRERLEFLNGSLKVRSKKGFGTVLRARLPLKNV